MQQSAIKLDSAAHGGEDVGVYAIGPMAHLMRSTQEQTYVAHLMLYSACVGSYKNESHCFAKSSSSLNTQSSTILTVLFALTALFIRV